MFDFTDRVAMITGASGNLGSALAQAFRRAGARLALVDRHEDLLRQEFPDLVNAPNCLFITCADLTSMDEVRPAVESNIANFGRVDVFVQTVGGFSAGTPLHETPLETLDFMLAVNAKAVFTTCQAVIPYMLQQGSGKIITLAARPGLRGRPNMAAYSAGKAAVIRFTESMAAELKDKGINVNCVLPGTIDTPQNRGAMPDADYGRWVTTESLADVILFLASDAARDVHGAAIPVYGRS